MELQIKSAPSISIGPVINNITSFLSGNERKNISVIKVNNENLATNGELCFLPSLVVWRNVLKDTEKCDRNCITILQHFLHIRNIETDNTSQVDISNQVLQLLVLTSKDWPIKIERYFLEEERVCLFLQRTPLIENSIKLAIILGENFGNTLSLNKVFSLRSVKDKESELTTIRLRLIQGVSEKVLHLYGCTISDTQPDYKYVFTSKSQGSVEDAYEKCVCGVVKNAETKCKETKMTWQQYIHNKMNELTELNQHKYFETPEIGSKIEDSFFENLAKAIATFELLSVKPSRSVFIGCNFATEKNTTNTKGASFVLYNTARIKTIIEKYNNKSLKGEYPNLPHITNIDFSLLNQEEEWELVYNFIIGYQQMIKDCMKQESILQTNPQIICIFLSRLCQKFSIYYRKIRILTEAYDHLIPTMTARLYMLHALQIVLQNALTLLGINPVSRM